MKKIYTLLALLILSSQFAFAQCTVTFGAGSFTVDFTNFQVTSPVLVSDNGTPSDPTDDQYTADLSFDLNVASPYFWAFEFEYAGNIISEPFYSTAGTKVFPNITLYGNVWPTSVSPITIEYNVDPNGIPFPWRIFPDICYETFPVNINSNPLSIVPNSLIVNNVNNTNQLKWDVINAQHIKSTSIEYSIDGSNFETLYKTNTTLSNFTHPQVLAGKHFYRIKLTDLHDQVKYSNVVSTETTGGTADFAIASTLIESHALLSTAQNKTVEIYNMQGFVVKKLDLKAGNQTVDLSNLAAGMYLVKSKTSTIKVVKQ
ncbi:MAG: hypothetical protein RL660_2834 [Bacteroidota bacterium]|jgi:hypothetical protein